MAPVFVGTMFLERVLRSRFDRLAFPKSELCQAIDLRQYCVDFAYTVDGFEQMKDINEKRRFVTPCAACARPDSLAGLSLVHQKTDRRREGRRFRAPEGAPDSLIFDW
jgi:hypothetical protein